MFRAIFRMKLGVKEWAKNLEIKHALMGKIEEQKKQTLIDDLRSGSQSNDTKWVKEAKVNPSSVNPPSPKKTNSTSRKRSNQPEVIQTRTTHDWMAEAQLLGANGIDLLEKAGITQTQTTDGWLAGSDANLTEPQTYPADETTTELTLGNPAPGETLERMKKRIAASHSAEKETKDQRSSQPTDSSGANLQIKIEIRLPKSAQEPEADGKQTNRNIMLTYDPASYRGGVGHIVTEDRDLISMQPVTKANRYATKSSLNATRSNRKPSIASEFDVSRPIQQTVISDTDNTDQSLVLVKTIKRKISKRRSSSAMATQSDLARLIASRKAAEAGYEIRGSPTKKGSSRRVTDPARD